MKAIVKFCSILSFLLVACSTPTQSDEEGVAVFSFKINSMIKPKENAEIFSDTLRVVRIDIFRDSVFVKGEELKLNSGRFVLETTLEQGKNYFAVAQAFISNLSSAAFVGNSGLFEIKAGVVTQVDISLRSTAKSVRILSPTDTLKNNATLSLKLVATFQDSIAKRDVTSSASWRLMPGVAASIDDWGKIRPILNGIGTETAIATYRGLSDTLAIHIVSP